MLRDTSFVSLPLPSNISNISLSPDAQEAKMGFTVSSTSHLPEIMKLLHYVFSLKAFLIVPGSPPRPFPPTHTHTHTHTHHLSQAVKANCLHNPQDERCQIPKDQNLIFLKLFILPSRCHPSPHMPLLVFQCLPQTYKSVNKGRGKLTRV